MSKDRKTTGNIKVSMAIAYQRVLDMKITTKEGTHGRLYLKVEADEGMQKDSIRPMIGQKVEVTLDDGTKLFTGTCSGAGIENTAEYKCVRIEAASGSIAMDREPKDCIFQDPGKTLKAIADKIGGSYGAEITLDSDVPIPHIVSQNHETDWEFLKRIAAAEGKVVYTDILEDGIRIFMGKTGLREFSDTVLGDAQMTRDASELASMEANEGSAEGYMVDMMKCESEELTMSAGDNAGSIP